MLKYAKIENEETKRCSVGLGTNTEFYKSIGMVEMDVEQSYNGSWYIAGYVPEKPEEVMIEEEITELQNYLNGTDWYAIRYAEIGVEIPEEVGQKRQEARERISALRNEEK